MKLDDPRFIQSLIEVSHIEFQSYDFYHRRLICTGGMAEKMLGYTKEEYFRLSENYYKEIVHADDWHLMTENVNKVMTSAPGEIIELELRIRKADGDSITVYSRKMVTSRTEDGFPLTVTTIIEDITELVLLRRQFEEKILQLRTISFMNSHLLRAPVAHIIGLIDLIEEKHITNTHNLQIFQYLKIAIDKLDKVIHEISEITQS